MTTILFVCTANRYRSPIAAACFKAELAKRKQEVGWTVLSAGTWATENLPPLPDAMLKARLMGLDIQTNRSRMITESMLREADLVVVMERGQQEALQVEFQPYAGKIALLSEIAEGITLDIPDPVMDPRNVDAMSEIYRLIQEGFDNLCAQATQNAQRSSSSR